MNRPELYHKTVDILVQAYFNDTLEHGSTCGCAVGNIIGHNLGHEFTISPQYCSKVGWNGNTGAASWWGGSIHDPKVIEEVIASGYSYGDLMKIEKAFEGERFMHQSEDESMFNGLMAVINTLDEIHDNKDTEVSTKSKSRFCKPSIQ